MIEQIVIALTGVPAVWLSQDKKPKLRRWAPILGLIGQPFWIYSSWKAQQWGIFVLCFLYTWGWARGLKTHWGRKPET